MTLIIFNDIIKYSIKYTIGMLNDKIANFIFSSNSTVSSKHGIPSLFIALNLPFYLLYIVFCSTFEVEFDIYG